MVTGKVTLFLCFFKKIVTYIRVVCRESHQRIISEALCPNLERSIVQWNYSNVTNQNQCDSFIIFERQKYAFWYSQNVQVSRTKNQIISFSWLSSSSVLNKFNCIETEDLDRILFVSILICCSYHFLFLLF